MTRSIVSLARAALYALALAALPTWGQPVYPTRPIRLVVPYPPGALTDLLARAIGDRLATALQQPVIVENKPGAGTLVGAEYVAKQPADGYTLLMATSTTLGRSRPRTLSGRITPGGERSSSAIGRSPDVTCRVC